MYHVLLRKSCRQLLTIISAIMVLLFVLCPVNDLLAADSNEDLNKEFIENYFQAGKQAEGDAPKGGLRNRTADEGAGLKIEEKPDADESESRTNEEGQSDRVSISTLGKILQISLVLLLGALIYVLSQRSKRKSRF